MKPPKSLLDPTFRYTSSANTDLRKTFARVRRQIAVDAARPRAVVTMVTARATTFKGGSKR